jgi:uncharacterized protein (DUF342 family)
MSMFESYGDEFSGVCQEISSKLSHVANYSDNHEENLNVLTDLQRSLEQAKTLIKQMEIETRGEQNPALKKEMNDKLAAKKKIIEGLRKDTIEAKQNEEHAALVDVSVCVCVCGLKLFFKSLIVD